MEHQVICEHPTIIVNPLLKDLIGRYLNVTIKGQTYYFKKSALFPLSLPRQVVSPYKQSLKTDFEDGKVVFTRVREQRIFHYDIDTSYVVANDTGEVFPVYIEVPCGRCDICKESKITSFVERCKMETQCYDSLPWFITLTYDDEHLPVDGVSIREIQLFLKRFRINLERSGYNFKLRYCCSGEYGKTTHRAHYHLIIWGLDVFDSAGYEKVGSILYDSWNKGYTMHRFIDPKDDKSFYYTAKYLRKDNFVPTYETPDGVTHPCNPFFFYNHEEMVV